MASTWAQFPSPTSARDPRDEDDAATIEVDRLDPADLLPLSPALSSLVGPLDGRQRDSEDRDSEDRDSQGSAALRTDTITATARPASFLCGPVRWLLPLGLLALGTLALAGWLLLAYPG